MGTVVKHINIEVTADLKQRNKEVKKTLKAGLRSDEFNCLAIATFQEDLTKINNYIKKLTKDGIFFEMTVCISEYEDDEQWNKFITKSFNFWKFQGYNDLPADISEMGVYLSPDTRYTDECNDCWYDFTLKSLPQV